MCNISVIVGSVSRKYMEYPDPNIGLMNAI